MFRLHAAHVESSSPECAVVAVDVLHVESGEHYGARVYLGQDEREFDVGAACNVPREVRRKLEHFVRRVRLEIAARILASSEAP
jgi:hypothetical protein